MLIGWEPPDLGFQVGAPAFMRGNNASALQRSDHIIILGFSPGLPDLKPHG